MYLKERDEYERALSDSFLALREMEHRVNETNLYMDFAIDTLVELINFQIESLMKAQDQKEKKNALCAIGALFIPGVPFTKSIKKGVNAAINGKASDWLSDQTCEELKFFDFLLEFAGSFAQLGTDVALLRTKEDFQNFDFGGLKRFMDANMFEILSDDHFYIDASCLLGLVEVDTSAPIFDNLGKSIFDMIKLGLTQFTLGSDHTGRSAT